MDEEDVMECDDEKEAVVERENDVEEGWGRRIKA